ncbi:MAG: DNA-3-methyladenine glycosylase [Candidatus Woesearchaeota archaeon]|nr:DNA-3-methyladenine glycosylase [Candidatus Woesearchaeota archaeon]
MIPQSFYKQSVITLARGLLGMLLVHETPEGTTVGKIVETEAYHEDDPAAHSFHGKTKRNAVMFGPAGHVYIYCTYGIHYCFNVVAGKEGEGDAVLIRALEPLKGISLMRTRRGRKEEEDLCSGPAKLVQAMGFTEEHNGFPLTGAIRIELGENPKQIVQTTRVGISKGKKLPYRFCIKNNRFLSRKSL